MRWRKIPAVILALCFLTPSALPQDASKRKSLFGELHIHTRWSFDAYIFIVRATPDDADAAARGEGVFDTVGCTSCHVPSLPGALGDVPLPPR